MRDLNRVVIHCSYTPPSMDIGADTIQEWHVDGNGWNDIGYHYVIRRKGQIESGRPTEIQGAHVRGHNDDSIGICLVGGMAEDTEQAESNFTRWQWNALATLLENLEVRFGRMDVCGHRDLDQSKACPCFNVKAWRAEP